MSVWGDIRNKSLGVEVRQEDYVEGMWEVTRMGDAKGFVSYRGKVEYKMGAYDYYKVNWRVMDKYHGEGAKRWYRLNSCIVFKNNMFDHKVPEANGHVHWKGLAASVFDDMMASMEKRLGKWDGITGKDGDISWTDKNEKRQLYIYYMVQMWNCAQMGCKFQEDVDNKLYDYYLSCFLSDIAVKYDKFIPEYKEEHIIK